MRIDLHLHSTASDGMLSPAAVVQAAVVVGLDVIALTDHDTAVGVPEARAAAGGAPIVIPGIELSSTHGGMDLHFLGYYIDADHAVITAHGAAAAVRRHDRMRGMIARLAALGIHVRYQDVLAAAGPDATAVGRPHLARALVQAGHVESFAEAFDRYLADGGPAFLPTELLTPREAIDLIHAAGGVAVWAHPPAAVLEREIRHFAGWGLDGIECHRPRNSPADIARLLDLARGLDLLATGGSDWHGTGNIRLGDFYIGRDEVGALLAIGGI